MQDRFFRFLAVFLTALALTSTPLAAQITTAMVSGTIKDIQGGVVLGATVVLVSETKGTRSVPAVTNVAGGYVFPNITADTYTVEVTLEGFHSVTRAGVVMSSGERVSVPVLTVEPGGTHETVNVIAESRMVQVSSGERSFAIATAQSRTCPSTVRRSPA
ncbi:MAG TPA: carboxypeptidase-like regulatory domain-containing protein [Vicinamibacterales bacterium]|nr:carboxypeptidase-like regulatory domain-containing protein [Vicinamibacterales bacterium]